MREQEMPLGLAMALSLDGAAMKRFEAMTAAEQADLIRRARMIRSKTDMMQLVSSVTDRTNG